MPTDVDCHAKSSQIHDASRLIILLTGVWLKGIVSMSLMVVKVP
jgi:hypothetical protein